MKSTAKQQPRALLVSIKTPKNSNEEIQESLAELERLVRTLGFQVIGKEIQKMPNTLGATAVGSGKVKELQTWFEASPENSHATVAVFDCELKPSQLKNLENALGAEVMDRTGVIIEIFSRHAKTRAARLQVEIARLNYLSPRLRETGSTGERQQGRGSGESQLETERREIRDRLADLKKELAKIQNETEKKRKVRAEQKSVALVGYTNAGKSSLMRALSGSEIYVEDKLFATLDTTVRAMKSDSHSRILISDTVGFIKKLPHDLIASFRSTLEEAINASLLLYVVDASDRNFPSQLAVVEEVLHEVGVIQTPVILVFNKCDRLNPIEGKKIMREFSDAMLISALNKNDIQKLKERILNFFEKEMVEEEIFAPYDLKGIIGEIRSKMRVIRETNEEDGVRYLVRAKPGDLLRLKKKYQIHE
jgi:GTP-binding protein HflX